MFVETDFRIEIHRGFEKLLYILIKITYKLKNWNARDFRNLFGQHRSQLS